MKSTEFLQSAMDVQKERGEQYDKPSGERSMGATVRAFNAITGYALEESDGWMLLGLLKLVRQAQNPEKYHRDSALDFVAYASLYAEAASEQCGQVEEAHSSAWSGAPEWAEWLAQDKNGEWNFYDGQPLPNDDENEWWVSHADGNQKFEFAGSIKPDSKNENWKSTLQRRPQ